MKKTLLLSLIALFLFIYSCGKKIETATIEIVDGVKIIHCTDTPLHPKKTVTFEEELTISGEDDAGNVILYQPSSYTVADNGDIYISDRSDNVIKVFDGNGQYLRTIGGKGGGPGEFESIGRMEILPDGKLLVMDYQLRRTSFFDQAGEFIESIQWRTSHYDLFFVTDSTYTINEYTFGEDRELLVKTFDFAHNEKVAFGKFTPYGMKMHRQGDMVMAISDPFQPHSVFIGDPNQQWLYHCVNDKYLIEVYDKDGNLLQKIDRPYQRPPFTEKDKQEFIDGFANNDNPAFLELARDMDFPELKLVTDRMLVDDLSNLWIVMNEEKEEDGKKLTAYEIFNKDGFYDTKVWLEFTPGRFTHGKMYRMDTDEETDIRSLKRYNVVWKD